MEYQDKRIYELRDCCDSSDVRRYVSVATDYLKDYSIYPGLRDELEDASSTYERMVQCYRDGLSDDRREEIHNLIAGFMHMTFLNFVINDRIQQNATLLAAKKRGESINLLEVADTWKSHMDDSEYYNTVFSALLTSWQWKSKTYDYYVRLITDTAIDKKLAALMISAIMLSCLCVFDIYKFKCLVDCYLRLDDIMLRERAFVGWVFCSSRPSSYGEAPVNKTLENLLRDEHVLNECLELQKQVIFCLDADKDGGIVKKEIIPNLSPKSLKHSFESDVEESSLNEILHPEQEEEQAEKLERSMTNMMNMQKAGSDIYFSGFSKMKSFAFFHRMSNWFLPYYYNNPVLQPLAKVLDNDDTFLKSIQNYSSFCESDKYSFSFAMEISLKSELAPVKSLIKQGLLFSNTISLKDDNDEATLARRMYLQDLLRFFRVSSFAGGIENPFLETQNDMGDNTLGFFLRAWKLEDDSILGQTILKFCRFLIKRKDYKRLGIFAPLLTKCDIDECILFYTLYLINIEHAYKEALLLLSMLSIRNEDATIVKAKAKCFMEMKMYEAALEEYEKLQKIKPSDPNLLKMAFCYLHNGKVEEAMKLLYELNYKHPDNTDVIRSLAWGNLLREEFSAAIDLYKKLDDMTKADGKSAFPEDVYNMGLCYWMSGNMDEACVCFRKYSETKREGDFLLSQKMTVDYHILQKSGIEFYEIFLMRDSVEKA